MSKIVFGPSITLGRKLTQSDFLASESSLRSYTNLLDSGSDVSYAVLVNNIGFSDTLAKYGSGGVAELVDEISERRDDCNAEGRLCQIVQMPEEGFEAELFDKDLLSYSLDLADGNYQGEFLRANVEPELLKRYISQLGLPDSSVLFSETKAKNLVNKRIKQSWRGIVQKVEGSNSAYIGTQQIRSRKAVPMCRGIMLAFYERLVMQGYEKGEFFLNKKENIAFEESFALYRRIAHLLPNTAEKPVLEIKTHFF